MYTLVASIILLSQLPAIVGTYRVELELLRQKARFYYHKSLFLLRKKCFQIYHYFYPKEEPVKVEVKPIETYENKYKKRFSSLKETKTEEELKQLKNNILFEITPNGNTIMFYDSTKKSFEYYSDKVIPYRFLDSVAKKYVIQFHCKNIYEDSQKDKVNKYTYLGKIANFSFLKKVEKGVTNKKLNMSFKDFKNMKI